MKTFEEYKTELKKIDQEAERQKYQLFKQYALTNALYKPGDIVEDHLGKLLVERVFAGGTITCPDTIYRGKVVNKNGSLSKKGHTRNAYQDNITRRMEELTPSKK